MTPETRIQRILRMQPKANPRHSLNPCYHITFHAHRKTKGENPKCSKEPPIICSPTF